MLEDGQVATDQRNAGMLRVGEVGKEVDIAVDPQAQAGARQRHHSVRVRERNGVGINGEHPRHPSVG